ncbi:mevalonate kinase [Pyrofollis japonicus]|uniref:mevalonate kinase n=1 Tax=Pyrofollis japonicus TaxID=3060460 RepID=UPI00295AD40D|nr:mevalonate kinase [Pyrofollis japonicus]BEP17074.1 mevalonate kinase [Pyrofollis japonicus]
MIDCVARAPGKIILLGEHWVVHGARAIAAAIGLYARAIGSRSHEDGIVVRSRELGVTEDISRECKVFCNLREAVNFLAKTSGREPWPANIVIESDIPMGAGLGSSAAVAVAFSACYAALGGLSLDFSLISRAAYESEKIVHGRPSGIDNTVATYGGFMIYHKERGFTPLSDVRTENIRLLVIDTGIPRSTGKAVALFSKRLNVLGAIGYRLLNIADSIVDETVRALKEGDPAKIGLMMDVAHGLLNAMGVSHEALEEVVHLARRLGAYGAKLTGAGMGGTAIALVSESNADIITKELVRKGYKVYDVEIGVGGVTYEGSS